MSVRDQIRYFGKFSQWPIAFVIYLSPFTIHDQLIDRMSWPAHHLRRDWKLTKVGTFIKCPPDRIFMAPLEAQSCYIITSRGKTKIHKYWITHEDNPCTTSVLFLTKVVEINFAFPEIPLRNPCWLNVIFCFSVIVESYINISLRHHH